MSSTGGGIATTFPLFCFAFALAYYFLYNTAPFAINSSLGLPTNFNRSISKPWRRNYQHGVKKNIWYLLIGFSFLIVSFASHKRGIYFLLPTFICISVPFLMLIGKEGRGSVKKLFPLIFLGLIVVVYGASHTRKLTVDNSRNSFSSRHVLNYSVAYSTGTNTGGATMGRISSTMRAITSLASDADGRWWCGLGPHTFYGHSTSVGEFNILYGITGFCRELVATGYFGAILYFMLFLYFAKRLLKHITKENNPYWKSLRAGAFWATIVFFLSYFGYNSSFSVSGVLVFTYFFIVGIVLSPHRAAVSDLQSSAQKQNYNTTMRRIP
ncbi:MAG: hypothetical protein GY777_31365 [Candidatus Brocadiaceae bacterium]|nr:hypothetical protein [Candidatus Brocadiaceae bacterium]